MSSTIERLKAHCEWARKCLSHDNIHLGQDIDKALAVVFLTQSLMSEELVSEFMNDLNVGTMLKEALEGLKK